MNQQQEQGISLPQMAKELIETHNLSPILVTNWERTGRLAYNYHTLTKTVCESAVYKYAMSVLTAENEEGVRYLLWLRLSVEDRINLKTLNKNSILSTEMVVDSLEAFRESLRRFLKKTPSESFGYMKSAKEMYISADSPISYSTFPNFRNVRNRWYINTVKVADLESEKAHLQTIYDQLFTNNQCRKLWLESVGRVE